MKNIFTIILLFLALPGAAQNRVFKLCKSDSVVFGFTGMKNDSLYNLKRHKKGVQQFYPEGKYEIYRSRRYKIKVYECLVKDSSITNEVNWNKEGVKIASSDYWSNGETKTYYNWSNNGNPLLVAQYSIEGKLISNKEYQPDGGYAIYYFKKDREPSDWYFCVAHFDKDGFLLFVNSAKKVFEEYDGNLLMKIKETMVLE